MPGEATIHHDAFRQALEAADARAAWSAARKVDRLALADALELVLLLAHDDPVNRFQVASARWTARYTLEMRAPIHETALIASQFLGMRTVARRAAIRTLGDHFDARGQRDLAGATRCWT